MMEKNIPEFSVLPKHIGIIMDGNGRWAKQRNLPRYKGHIEGAKTFRRIGEFAAEVGVKCLTFYAFSTENWKRPQEEVDAIMQLFREYLIEADERTEENKEKGITLRFIAEVEEKNVFSGRRILNKELKIAFDKHHISIPFPQLDLHTK